MSPSSYLVKVSKNISLYINTIFWCYYKRCIKVTNQFALDCKESYPPLTIHNGDKEILRLENDGTLIIDPQDVDEAARQLVESVRNMCVNIGAGHPFKEAYVQDLETKLAELQSNLPSIKETHNAKKRMMKGYAIYYPHLDPRLSLLGVEHDGDYKVEAYGNTLIRTTSLRTRLWGIYALGVAMGIIVGALI